MRILLTGPFGTVGSGAVQHLLRLNAQRPLAERIRLTCFDRKAPRAEHIRQRLLGEAAKGSVGRAEPFETIWSDLQDRKAVEAAVRDVDAVVHLAAIIPPMAYELPADLVRNVNVNATQTLLEACAAQKVPPRFVFASSYSVVGCRNPNKPVTRMTGEDPLNPQDFYSSHKAKCELLVRDYNGPWSILRLCASPSPVEEMFSFAQGGGKKLPFLMYSVPWNQRRHAVHYRDAGRAFMECAVTLNDINGKVLLIGGDDSWCMTVEEFFNLTMNAMGIGSIPREIFRNPPADGDAAFYYEEWMDTTESQKLLNYQHHKKEDYVREINSYLGHYRPIVKMLAPLIRYGIVKNSPHYKYNMNGLTDPLASKPFANIMDSPSDSVVWYKTHINDPHQGNKERK